MDGSNNIFADCMLLVKACLCVFKLQTYTNFKIVWQNLELGMTRSTAGSKHPLSIKHPISIKHPLSIYLSNIIYLSIKHPLSIKHHLSIYLSNIIYLSIKHPLSIKHLQIERFCTILSHQLSNYPSCHLSFFFFYKSIFP